MDRLEEVRRLEKVADPIERLVVDEDRAQECLLRLDVMRRRTLSRCGVVVCLARSRFGCHDVPVLWFCDDIEARHSPTVVRNHAQ
jgi:hypothetical protein